MRQDPPFKVNNFTYAKEYIHSVIISRYGIDINTNTPLTITYMQNIPFHILYQDQYLFRVKKLKSNDKESVQTTNA